MKSYLNFVKFTDLMIIFYVFLLSSVKTWLSKNSSLAIKKITNITVRNKQKYKQQEDE